MHCSIVALFPNEAVAHEAATALIQAGLPEASVGLLTSRALEEAGALPEEDRGGLARTALDGLRNLVFGTRDDDRALLHRTIDTDGTLVVVCVPEVDAILYARILCEHEPVAVDRTARRWQAEPWMDDAIATADASIPVGPGIGQPHLAAHGVA